MCVCVCVQCGWYWGPMNWEDAEMKLKGKPDGSFLVRDSSDPRYILSLSFRSQSVTHHTRMEHYRGTTHTLFRHQSENQPLCWNMCSNPRRGACLTHYDLTAFYITLDFNKTFSSRNVRLLYKCIQLNLKQNRSIF